MNNFDLKGHDCPYGRYPAPVIPIGELDGKLVAVYPGGGAPEQIAEDADDEPDYVHHSHALRERLAGFDFATHRLFAWKQDEVVSYPAEGERDFFLKILDESEFPPIDPFMRLALAKQTDLREVVLAEMEPCYRRLLGTSASFAERWRCRELVALLGDVLVVPFADAGFGALVEVLTQAVGPRHLLLLDKPEARTTGVSVIVFRLGDDGQGPTLLYVMLAADADSAGSGASCVPIQYTAGDLENDPSKQALELRLCQAMGNLLAAHAERFRESAEAVLQYVLKVRAWGKVLAGILEPLKKYAVSRAEGVQESGHSLADLDENWQTYKTCHTNNMEKYLNGSAASTREWANTLLRQSSSSGSLNGLPQDLDHLWSAADAYREAFEFAQSSLGEDKAFATHLLRAVVPLDGKLADLNTSAVGVITGLARVAVDRSGPGPSRPETATSESYA